MNISTRVRNAAGKAITDLIDDGSDNPNGYLEIRTGSRPATPQVAAPGTLLATLPFSNPAYGAFTNGVALVNPIGNDPNIAATGTAGWFRVYDRDGRAIMDGTITVEGGGGDLELDDVNFIEGGTVVITELTATMPM